MSAVAGPDLVLAASCSDLTHFLPASQALAAAPAPRRNQPYLPHLHPTYQIHQTTKLVTQLLNNCKLSSDKSLCKLFE